MMMRKFVPLWQNEQQDIAMKALESLCENSKDEAQVLTALRYVKLELKTILITILSWPKFWK